MPDFRGKIARKSGTRDVRGHNILPEGSQTSNNNIVHAACGTLRVGCNPGDEDVANNWSVVLNICLDHALYDMIALQIPLLGGLMTNIMPITVPS